MFSGEYFKRTSPGRIDATAKAKEIFKFLNLKHLAESVKYTPSMFHQRINRYEIGQTKRTNAYFTYTTLFKLRMAVDSLVKQLLSVHKELTDIIDEMELQGYDNTGHHEKDHLLITRSPSKERQKEKELQQ